MTSDDRILLTALKEQQEASNKLITYLEAKLNQKTFVTAHDASEKFGISPDTLRHMARDGRISSSKSGNILLVCLDDLEDREHRRPGSSNRTSV